MRQHTHLTAIMFIFLALGFCGCKKQNSGKDYSPLFKDKVWTGEMHYSGMAVQPMSIEFAAAGQVTWHELSGNYDGDWKIDAGKIVITLGNTGIAFKALISDDNKLTSIENSDPLGRFMDNAVLNATADAPLDNSTWTAPNLIMKFKTGNKVDLTLGASPGKQYNDIVYVREGKSLRFDPLSIYHWFIVVNSVTTLKGVNKYTGAPAVYPFTATNL